MRKILLLLFILVCPLLAEADNLFNNGGIFNKGSSTGGSGWTITDGSNTVTGTTQLTVTGGTVGGSTPNATLSITSGNIGIGTSNDVTYWGPSNTLKASNNFQFNGTNVGIGTSLFQNSLSIKNNVSIGTSYNGQTAPSNGAIIQGNVGIGTWVPAASLEIGTHHINGNMLFLPVDLAGDQLGFMGIYSNGKYYGITTSIPKGAIGGVPVVSLGSFFNGLAVEGSSDNTGTPIFAVGYPDAGCPGGGCYAAMMWDTGQMLVGNAGPGPQIPAGVLTVNGNTTIGSDYYANGYQAPANGLIEEGQMGSGMTPPAYQLDINDSQGTGFDIGDSTNGSWNITSSGVINAVSFVTGGGTSSQFVKGDGSLDSTAYGTVTSSGSPVTGNIAKFTSSTNIAPAAAANIVSLFSGCSGTLYLGADGACHNAGGSASAAGGTNAVEYNSGSSTFAGKENVFSMNGTNVGIGTSNGKNLLDVQGTVQSNAFEITSAGNVGVGSATPGQILDVQGTIRATQMVDTGVTASKVVVTNGSQQFVAATNLTDTAYSTAVGANPTATVGTAAVNGSSANFMRSDGAPAINLTMSPSWTGNHTFAPSSGNTVFTAGNVGIGSATPGQILDVQGTVRMTGFNLNSGSSLNNKILTSDASGNGTWQTASSGSGTVNSGTANQAAYYASSTTAVSGTSDLIFNGSNVGIGSATPGQILDVQGTMRSSSLIGTGVGNVGVGTYSILASDTRGAITQTAIGTSAPEQSLNYYGRYEIKDGTVASPAGVGWFGGFGINTFKVSRYDDTRLGQCDGTGTDSECDAAISADVSQDSTATNNSAALYGFIKSSSTSSIDATGVYGFGTATANAKGTGAYFEGDRTNTVGSASGAEVRVVNLTSGNGTSVNTNNTAGSLDGLLVDGQGDGTNATTLSSGIRVMADIGSNAAKFGTGLTFNSNSIVSTGTTIDDNSGGAIGVNIEGNHTYALLTTASAGNVGINTTTPFQNFTVVGNVGIGTTVSNGLMKNFSPAAPGGNMYIQGNIGVGTWDTTTENGQIQIYNKGTASFTSVTSGAANYAQFTSVNDVGNIFAAGMGSSSAALVPNTGFNGTGGTQDFVLYTNNTVAMTIKGSGQNIGIGSVTPGQKLDVQGTIRALSGGTCTTLYKCNSGIDAGVIQTSACALCPSGTCVALNGCF